MLLSFNKFINISLTLTQCLNIILQKYAFPKDVIALTTNRAVKNFKVLRLDIRRGRILNDFITHFPDFYVIEISSNDDFLEFWEEIFDYHEYLLNSRGKFLFIGKDFSPRYHQTVTKYFLTNSIFMDTESRMIYTIDLYVDGIFQRNGGRKVILGKCDEEFQEYNNFYNLTIPKKGEKHEIKSTSVEIALFTFSSNILHSEEGEVVYESISLREGDEIVPCDSVVSFILDPDMWLVIALFLVVLGLLIFLDSKKPKNYPPGPKWLPLFGSALKVLKERKRTGYLYVATAEMSKKYGPVVGLKVGKDLLVIVYGAQAMREFLLSDDLAGRPTGPFFEMRTWGKRLGIMLTDSDFWHEQRRFILKQLKEFGFGRRNMSHMIEEEAGHMISDIKSAMNNNGSLITDMESIFGIHVLNTLWTMLAGIRYNSQDKGLKQLQGILGELFTQIDMVGAPFSHFPVLRFIAPELSGYKMYVKTHQLIWDFINKELKRHKETHNPDDPRDLMDVYINILKSPERKSTFTEDQLLAICLDMFMAGSETTNKSLGFMFLYLLKHPEVQKKAQEEIDQVVGKERLPSLGDRINMPYLESCVIETLRVFSGRAFTIPHRAMKDTHLNGYFIPKDSIVIANLHGVHMGEESGFDDPFEFRPERHMTNGKLKPVPDSFIPFGFGKHRCLGEALARANLFLLTATMLQNFDFSVPPGHKISMECTDGVTPGPKPFKALITLRTK
ncbi:hypothetical protein WA026_013195 [Henosepilachna vigintioctopunctata]|uniref:Cytochrome P450 n=1 Tax=Henosepilachna vigintioctopunctata TaxID=420089 RepID=A0AAW1UDY0_9CUCU